jgi:hypothetical protein
MTVYFYKTAPRHIKYPVTPPQTSKDTGWKQRNQRAAGSKKSWFLSWLILRTLKMEAMFLRNVGWLSRGYLPSYPKREQSYRLISNLRSKYQTLEARLFHKLSDVLRLHAMIHAHFFQPETACQTSLALLFLGLHSSSYLLWDWGTRYRSWLGHYATSLKVVGFISDEVIGFNWPNPSRRTMALGSTQRLTEMSTRNPSRGVRRVGLNSPPSVSCLDNGRASTSHNPMGLHGLLQE